MRKLYEPATIAAIVVAVAAVAGAATTAVGQAQAAKEQKKFRQQQAEQERIQRARDLQDLEQERKRVLARSRAALAAAGGDLSSGTPFAVLKSQDEAFGEERRRLLEDSGTRERSFLARASSISRSANLQIAGTVFGGVARGTGTTTSLLRRQA